ncbi:MAG: hypothetical protein IJX89_00155 [Alphaproteobacteria bacterium]|nr:hypothetical protein [Alphaproteobacteria bacterium]
MKYLLRLFSKLIVCAAFLTPVNAMAGNIVDALNLAPFVPYVLDSMMLVASGGYEFFVGSDGDGIIYILIWGFLGITLTMYLLKLYLPKQWTSLFGFSAGKSLADGNVAPMTIAENMLKPGLRAVIAVVALLQIKPVYLTEWLVNPFLQFGALYTHAITETINDSGMNAPKIECPADIVDKGWLTQSSCEFLVQPVSDLSHANNQIIKKGFEFIDRGLRGLITLVPHGGEDFMNLITGIILVFTFVSSNLFMAMLVINAIFKFGMALILYPFYVLTYVAKPSDKWFDIWPAFGGITKALQDLIITMIACAFILCINLAIIKSLFDWNSSVFVVAAGGSTASNIPTVANNSIGFGGHSLTWMSALLTFYLMFRIFEITQKQLKKYAPGMDGLYNQVRGDAKTVWKGAKDWGGKVGKAIGWIKKK